MGRIIILLALILMALAIFMIVRAMRASRASHDDEIGYQVIKFDRLNAATGRSETVIMLKRANLKGQVQAVIGMDDRDYSERVVEEFARASVKADDWNSTNRALQP